MNEEFRADLHVHSCCSDGSETPLQLLDLAKTAGLSGLSITDHDTIAAYTDDFALKAKSLNLEILLGVEISSEWEGITVHILAYAFDARLQHFLDQVILRRKERNFRILEKLKTRGILLSEKDLCPPESSRVVGRSHIAQALIRSGVVASMREAFEWYLKDSAPCYATGGKFSPREVIDAIHQARGKAVLAHPHLLTKRRTLRELLTLPFDGLECYYGLLLSKQELPWVEIARAKNWLATGGSDYHGQCRPYIPIGCSWVGEAVFRKLQAI